MDRTVSYDEQAEFFDKRVGLSDAVAREVVAVVRELVLADTQGAILEIGAGTGELGHWLAAERRYVGIDSSSAMLEKYRKRGVRSGDQTLICADGNESWPVESGEIGLVFGSRVFHLLEVDHVAAEFARVSSPGGAALLSGRVRRQKDSVKTLMRQKMRECLEEEGYVPREAEKDRKVLLQRLVAGGATRLDALDAASWEAHHRPIDSIRSWREKSSIGGVSPSVKVKERVLSKLETWGRETFGDLDRPVPTKEFYQLEGVRRTGEVTR